MKYWKIKVPNNVETFEKKGVSKYVGNGLEIIKNIQNTIAI